MIFFSAIPVPLCQLCAAAQMIDVFAKDYTQIAGLRSGYASRIYPIPSFFSHTRHLRVGVAL